MNHRRRLTYSDKPLRTEVAFLALYSLFHRQRSLVPFGAVDSADGRTGRIELVAAGRGFGDIQISLYRYRTVSRSSKDVARAVFVL